jgi:hypothetical protein
LEAYLAIFIFVNFIEDLSPFFVIHDLLLFNFELSFLIFIIGLVVSNGRFFGFLA